MYRAFYKFPGSPIDWLPVEILSYIFVLGAYTGEAEGVDADPHRPRLYESKHQISPCLSHSPSFPYLIASVSRHWREVALTTPQLWSNICVSADNIASDSTRHEVDRLQSVGYQAIYRHLSRSGGHPLDIFIDARDPDWDFSEFDTSATIRTTLTDDDLSDDYTHPFSVAQMQLSLNILLPHIRRFRSLAILTDRWAPMHTALSYLSAGKYLVATNTSHAPLLETLVLMRCNEFASYAHEFTPHELKDPSFLPFSGALETFGILPRLTHLTLSGVHVSWSAFPRLLPLPSPELDGSGLQALEMSYHCTEVRQSDAEFAAILRRCPRLEELTIRLSGPLYDTDDAPDHIRAPVSLPRLTTLTFGYDDAHVAVELLRMLDAPQLATLTLEDASYPSAVDHHDSGPLLAYCAGGAPASLSHSAVPRFPHIVRATLHGVKAPREAFRGFFMSAPRLQVLALVHTALAATRALRPRADQCPCPLLEGLSIRGESQAMDPTVSVTLAARAACGAPLRDVCLEAGPSHSISLGEAGLKGDGDKYAQTVTQLITGYQTAGGREHADESGSETVEEDEELSAPRTICPGSSHDVWNKDIYMTTGEE